jgi:hypothetical protein
LEPWRQEKVETLLTATQAVPARQKRFALRRQVPEAFSFVAPIFVRILYHKKYKYS